MAGNDLEFLKAPEENLKTWELIRKIMLYSAAAVLLVLWVGVVAFT